MGRRVLVGATGSALVKNDWGLGHRADPIDPKAVKIGAEQADYRALKPWDEARFIVSRLWAIVRWPARMLRRATSRPSNDRDQ